MTVLTTVRPYYRLSDVLKEDVDAALAGFRAYLTLIRPKVSSVRPAPKSDTVSPLPESELWAPNLQTGYNLVPGEIAALLQANGESICSRIAKSIHRDESSVRKALKRMLERGEVAVRHDKNKILYRLVDGVQIEAQAEPEMTKRRNNVRAAVLALIAERGPLTSSEVAEQMGLAPAWANTLMCRMRADGALHVVGNKRNEKHYWLNVYHTDPDFAYVPPAPPKPAEPVVEKRPARIPSVAAVDRGLALIAKHFHADSGGKAVFEQLCRRSQSVPELSAVLKMDDMTVRFALRRLIQIEAIEEDGKEVTYDRTNRKHLRQVYAVVEANE